MNTPIARSDELRIILYGQMKLILRRLAVGIPIASALLNAAWVAECLERTERPTS
jgi:hypothetical protein